MTSWAEALAIARASFPYFQEQHDTKPNRYTAARLADAKRTLDIMEELK